VFGVGVGAKANANARKAAVRATIERVSAQQEQRLKLIVRSIGLKRAEAAICVANIAYNLGRWRWWETCPALA
jgi:hypothetical protein